MAKLLNLVLLTISAFMIIPSRSIAIEAESEKHHRSTESTLLSTEEDDTDIEYSFLGQQTVADKK